MRGCRPEIAAVTARQLAAPLKRMTIIVGTAEGGTWVTGPLAGRAAP